MGPTRSRFVPRRQTRRQDRLRARDHRAAVGRGVILHRHHRWRTRRRSINATGRQATAGPWHFPVRPLDCHLTRVNPAAPHRAYFLLWFIHGVLPCRRANRSSQGLRCCSFRPLHRQAASGDGWIGLPCVRPTASSTLLSRFRCMEDSRHARLVRPARRRATGYSAISRSRPCAFSTTCSSVARTHGIRVRIDGTGACGTWPDAEDVETVQLG